MKLHFTLILFFVSITTFSKADQYACLTDEMAKQASDLMHDEKELVVFCNPCSNLPKQKIKLDSVRLEKTRYCNGMVAYGLVIEGNAKGEKIREELDLAYTWLNVEGVGRNVALMMNLPVYDVGEPFFWKSLKTYELPVAKKKQLKLRDKLVDSIEMEIAIQKQVKASNFYDSWVQVDSVQFMYFSESNTVEFTYFLVGSEEKKYELFLDELSEFKLEIASRELDYLNTSGTGFVQYTIQGKIRSNMPYRYHNLPVRKSEAQALIRQLNQLQSLTRNYQFK